MKDPKLHLGLNVNEGRASRTMNLSDGGGRPTWVNLNLRDVESGGYLAFCQRLRAGARPPGRVRQISAAAAIPDLQAPARGYDGADGALGQGRHRRLHTSARRYVPAYPEELAGLAEPWALPAVASLRLSALVKCLQDKAASRTTSIS